MKFLNELGIWAIMPIFLENVGPVQGFKQKTFTNLLQKKPKSVQPS